MKQLITTLIALLLSTPVFADFIRAEVGTGMWNAKASGEARFGSALNFDLEKSFGMDSTETTNYIWAYVKHPLPVIPNVRVEMSKFETAGKVSSVEFGGVTYNSNEESLLNLDQTDAIIYYNILDNTFWITLDLGLDLKTFNGELMVANDSTSIKGTVPLFYVRGRVEIPATDLGFEVDSKHLSISGSTISDMRAKVDYDFLTTPILDLGVEAGYRTQSIILDSSDFDVKADITVSGAFLGITGKF